MSDHFAAGQYFFHYTTSELAFAYILGRNELKFSLYQDMRDPLENKDWRFPGAYHGKPDEPEKAWFEFHVMANRIRERSHLLSFTVDAPAEVGGEKEPFNRGWARARMWEQYAENHRGVCLVFAKDALIKAIMVSLRDQDFALPYHHKVDYDGSAMQAPMLPLSELAGKVSAAEVSRFIEEHHDDLFFLKALDWATEHEYRFVTTSSDGKDLFVDYGDSLAGVIVGEQFPIWQRPAAIEVCERKKVLAKRMDWSMGRPLLGDLRPIRNRRDEIREAISQPLPIAGPPAAPTTSSN